MSLFRSASGPAGLSINTNAANAGGSTAAPGLFGSGAATGGLFGGGSQTQTQTQTPASANTAGSLFGGGSTNPMQQGTAGGLFGSTNNAQPRTQTPTGGLFGGGGATTQQNTGTAGGLFGGGAPAQQNTGTAGGLFGTSTTQPQQQQQQPGGLFGGAQQQQPQQQQQPGGLFGGAQLQQQQQPSGGLFGGAQQQQQPAAGGLFGGANPQQQQQQPVAGGLFGGANPQQQQPQQAAAGGLFGGQKPGGLFGNTPAAPSQPAVGGLFGGAQQSTQAQPNTTGLFGGMPAQQQQGGSLFNSTAQPPAPTGGLLGQSTGFLGGARPAQTMSATQINYDMMQGRTRFDDLAKSAQDEIAAIDAGVERIMTMQNEIAAFMPKQRDMVDQLTRDVNFVQTKFKRVERVLKKDVSVVNALKEATKTDIDNAQVTRQAIENLKLPAQYHTPNLWAPSIKGKEQKKEVVEVANLIGLFNKAVVDLEARHKKLTEYRTEIASHLPNVENGLYERVKALRDGRGENDPHRNSLRSILETIETLHETILALASQCVKTRDQLEKVQVKLPPIGQYRTREVN